MAVFRLPLGWWRRGQQGSFCKLAGKSLAWCHAGVAQLVERELPKLEVAGSNPVARSSFGQPGSLPDSGYSA